MKILWLISLICCTSALYEDQVGKLDWKKEFVGEIKHLAWHEGSRDTLLIVGTGSNVLAGLDADLGTIKWRHNFEENNSIGEILDLALTGRHVVTVSGSHPLFLRIWDPISGALVQEHLVKQGRVPDMVSIQKGVLHLINYDGSDLEIVNYEYDTRKIGEAVRTIVPAPFPASTINNAFKCVVDLSSVLTCVVKDQGFHSLFLSDKQMKFSLTSFSGLGLMTVDVDSLRVAGGYLQLNSVDGVARLTATGTEVKIVKKVASEGVGRAMLGGCGDLVVKQKCVLDGVDSEGRRYCSEFNQVVEVESHEGLDMAHEMPDNRGKLEEVWTDCGQEPGVYQVVLKFEDGSLVSLTPRGNVMFLREEGLARIRSAVLVSPGETSEVGYNHARNIYSHGVLDIATLLENFLGRLKRHVSVFQTLIQSVADFRLTGSGQNTADKFGLRKVVVAVTEHSKVYGLDSKTGAVLWQIMFPGKLMESRGTGLPHAFLHLQRDSKYGAPAQAVLVYQHHRSTHFIMTFNPVTGDILANNPVPLPLDQVILLPDLGDDLRALLLVGKDGRVLLHPPSAIDSLNAAPPMYLVTVTEGEGVLTGNKLTIIGGGDVSLTPVWSLASHGARVIAVEGRNPDEKVHSAGKVLADRSVLFKYMNPNLALVLAEGADSSAKTFINIYLVDLVTGKVHYSATHKKVLPPFHIVISENWAVYTYYNEKSRRTELSSLELYEGKTQSNASMFSSLDNVVSPFIERQSFILPSTDVTALKETNTEKGITSKHLLVATSTGSILDMPIHLVDPRRPSINTAPALREPGLAPYIPELRLPSESILNYNQSIAAIRGIVTAPSGLESTTIVFAYGLDLYGTRIAPSKEFDVLKDDFDHFVIAAVLVGLVAFCIGTRKLAQRKALKQAWK